MLVVEQNAAIALEVAARAYVLEVGQVAVSGTSARAAPRRSRPTESTWVLMAARWPSSSSRSSRGLAIGGDLRLARARARAHPPRDGRHQLRPGRDGDVLDVHRLDADRRTTAGSYWPAFVAHARCSRSSAASASTGRDPAARERARSLTVVIVTIGLLLIIQRRSRAWIWSAEVRGASRARSRTRPGRSAASRSRSRTRHDRRRRSCSSSLLWAFFQFTKLGLALRAAARQPRREPAGRRPRAAGCSRSAGGSRPCSARSPG